MILSNTGTNGRRQRPPTYAEDPVSEFYAYASQVYTTSLTLTEEQKTIAQFWADTPGVTGTSPGHWVAVMSQIARHDGLSLMTAAESDARVGIAGLVPPLQSRTFNAFDEATEAAISRLYGGIHSPFGNQNGLLQGRCIGQIIFDRVQFKR